MMVAANLTPDVIFINNLNIPVYASGNILKDLNKKLNLTIVIATHEMKVVKKLCTRVSIFKDGKIEEYTCSNFDEETANKNFVKENLMFNRDTLPLGEFAIGTNTTAYVMAEQYGIAGKLPILIAEKMGPHFAMGDTCYAWAEDSPMYNPDGKEVIARENEVSAKRKEDPSKAYFGCHTDITIPYRELQSVAVEKADGTTIPLIEDGRFVLPGTEELNEPFG